MQIILYLHHIHELSGINTWVKSFVIGLGQFYDIKIVYTTARQARLEEFRQIAECIEYNGQVLECDVCIYASTQRKSPKIIAKKYLQMIHADHKKWGADHNQSGIDQYIAVSETIQAELKRDKNIESTVISNILIPPMPIKRILKLVTASRIAPGKGMDRIPIMAKKLKEAGVLFRWEILGAPAGREYLMQVKRSLVDVPEVRILGYSSDVASFMHDADYTVQLSDDEGYCYSVYESLRLGVPVVVTDWDGVRQDVNDGDNGYILDMQLSNLDINKLFLKPKKIEFVDNNLYIIQKWRNLLDSIGENEDNGHSI